MHVALVPFKHKHPARAAIIFVDIDPARLVPLLDGLGRDVPVDGGNVPQ